MTKDPIAHFHCSGVKKIGYTPVLQSLLFPMVIAPQTLGITTCRTHCQPHPHAHCPTRAATTLMCWQFSNCMASRPGKSPTKPPSFARDTAAHPDCKKDVSCLTNSIVNFIWYRTIWLAHTRQAHWRPRGDGLGAGNLLPTPTLGLLYMRSVPTDEEPPLRWTKGYM